MDKSDVIRLLEEEVKRLGSQRALADRLGVTPAYLGDVLRGRRDPGPAILEALGLEKDVIYRSREAK